MNDFRSIVEFGDPTVDPPAEADPKFSQKVKSIDWRNINNRATIAMNILSSLANIIDAIQRAVAYTNTVRVSLPALVAMKSKVGAAQALVRPIAARGRTTAYGGFQPRVQSQYGPPRNFESLDTHLASSLQEDIGDWEKASIIAGAISAVIALIGQLINLISDFPEYKEKIGQLVAGMKKDAEDLRA